MMSQGEFNEAAFISMAGGFAKEATCSEEENHMVETDPTPLVHNSFEPKL